MRSVAARIGKDADWRVWYIVLWWTASMLAGAYGSSSGWARLHPPTPNLRGRGVCCSGLFELIFARAADRTGPVIGNISKSGSWGDAVIGIAIGGIVFIATDNTGVFFHHVSSQVRLNQAFHNPWRLQYSRADTWSALMQKVASGAWPGARS